MGLADKIRENHELAATTQQALRNGRRVIRRIAEETPISVPALIETQSLPQPVPIPHTAITVSPLDLPAEQFKAGLDRRKANRELLMEWLRSALVEGVDFGRIHVVSKERCQFARQGRVKDCGDPHHWSKPSLFKPGAEKITGMLGMTVHYPSLPDYEQAVLNGTVLSIVMLRCELRDAHGRPVAEGVGARSLGQDYGDFNKTLKMAEKSAHIDATLRLAGLSEIYTQDIEDRPVVEEEPDAPLPPKPRRSATAATTATDSGIRRMFQTQRDRFFPLPDYRIDENELGKPRVEVTLPGQILDPKYTQVLMKRDDLDLRQVLLLDSVQKRRSISPEAVKELKGLKLIEGRSPNFFVSAKVAEWTSQKGHYIRTRGLDDNYYQQLVLEYLGKYKKASRRDLDELLVPKLPDVLDAVQKGNKIKNLLQSLRRQGQIHPEGPRSTALWKLGAEPVLDKDE